MNLEILNECRRVRAGRPTILARIRARNARMAADDKKRIILEVDSDLFDEIQTEADRLGCAIDELLISYIEAALPDDEPAKQDDPDAGKKVERQRSKDGKGAGSTENDDPSNGGNAQLTPAEAHAEALALKGQIEGLTYAGRFAEARDLEKVATACAKIEAKQNQPSAEELRKRLVDSIVSTANQLFGR
jgi:hypothetical protein